MSDLFDLYDPGHDFHDYDDPNGEWRRRVELDEEKEPGAPFVVAPRRNQLRYSRLSFLPAKRQIEMNLEIWRAS